MKTSELTGAALDWAVAKCEGKEVKLLPGMSVHTSGSWEMYSTDWSKGGPIIEREKIRLDCAWNPGPWTGCCKIDGHTGWTEGPTPLIAAMRCYVSSELGDEIEIPEELK